MNSEEFYDKKHKVNIIIKLFYVVFILSGVKSLAVM